MRKKIIGLWLCCQILVLVAQGKEVIYIDFVTYHTANKVFVSVDMGNFSKSKYSTITKDCDSIADEKELDIQRLAIPYNKIKKLANIDTSLSILIYNRNHKLVSRGKFDHFEYFDTFDGEFIACYKLDKLIDATENGLYYVSENTQKLFSKNYAKSLPEPSSLKLSLAKYLRVSLDSIEVFNSSSILLTNNDTVSYSVLSFSVNNKEELKKKSVLIRTINGKNTTFFQQFEEYEFTEILQTLFYLEAKPIVLFRYGFPDMENTGSKIGYFQNGKFVLGNSCIELKK